MMADKTLNNQQILWVMTYVKNLDGVAADKAAKYKVGHHKSLLKQPHIIAAINRHITSSGILPKPSTDRILQELMRIAFFDPADLFNDDGSVKMLSEIPEDARRCIAGLELSLDEDGETVFRKYKIIDKHKALENLGRHLAMFTDKLKVDLPTELGNMTDEQVDAAIRQLTEVTSSLAAAAGKAKTTH